MKYMNEYEHKVLELAEELRQALLKYGRVELVDTARAQEELQRARIALDVVLLRESR